MAFNVCSWWDDVIKWKHFRIYWPFVREPPLTGEFPSQRPVTRSFDIFFHLLLTKRSSKQSRRWWSPTPSRLLWRHCDVIHSKQCGVMAFYGVGKLSDNWFRQWLGTCANSVHYCDAIMGTVASQITSLTIVYTTVYSDADQSKHQSSASLAFVWGIHRDRWIPRTKGQLRGKCFHLMTSSWFKPMWLIIKRTIEIKFQWYFDRNSNIFISKKMHIKMPSAKWQPFCSCFNIIC